MYHFTRIYLNNSSLIFLHTPQARRIQSRMQQKNLTAKAWILMDAHRQIYLRGSNTQQKRQIASLTKMYTLYACLSLNDALNIHPHTTTIKTFLTPVNGTSANLLPDRYITLYDLYHALMLPSGNDAACLLACYYGSWIASASSQRPTKAFRKESLGDRIKYYELYVKKFVHYINHSVVKLELKHTQTHFENPHGLQDKNQVSTVWELAEASLKFLDNQVFAKVSSCASYRGIYIDSQDVFQWTNTNILLKQGYKGIKTGLTSSAGGCLASLTQIWPKKYQKVQLLIVVIGSYDGETRFSDTRLIVQDYIKYLKMMSL